MARKRQNSSRSSNLPLILMVAGGLLLLAAALLLLTRNRPTAQTATPIETREAGVPRVTPQDAKAAFDAQSAVFVDVRGPAGYNAGHVPGALLLPVNDLATRWTELDPNDWIILYCT